VRSHTLRAVRLTAEVERRLRCASGSGRIHSIFARTINIELDDPGEADWVSLHGPGPIPAPFGIACEAVPVMAGLEGASVRIEADAIMLYPGAGPRAGATPAMSGGPPGCATPAIGVRIKLDGAALVDTMLPTPAPLPSLSRCLAGALAGVTAGLLPATAALLTGTTAPADPLARTAWPALAGLHAATAVRDEALCLTAARPLLGLGPGLTPAGDDVMVGWLAGAWTAGIGGRQLAEATGPGLLAEATHRTGRLSRAFLAAAVAGDAAEPVHRFVLAPDEASLAGVLGLGATSGADLLAGYLLARAALATGERRP